MHAAAQQPLARTPGFRPPARLRRPSGLAGHFRPECNDPLSKHDAGSTLAAGQPAELLGSGDLRPMATPPHRLDRTPVLDSRHPLHSGEQLRLPSFRRLGVDDQT
jgi:hypothetical protein